MNPFYIAGNLGFIYLAFDIKSRFSTAPGYIANCSVSETVSLVFSHSGASLCGCVNECVESLCASLESDPQKILYIRETLHSALPHLNCKCNLDTLSSHVSLTR